MEEHFGVLEPPEMEPFQKGSVIAYAYYIHFINTLAFTYKTKLIYLQ